MTAVNSGATLDLKYLWVRGGKPAKKQMSMCFRLDKAGFNGSGAEIGPLSSICFHTGENKKDVKQISVIDKAK